MRYEQILNEAVMKYLPAIQEISGKNLEDVVVEAFPHTDSILENLRIGLSLVTGMGDVTLGMVSYENITNGSQSKIQYRPAIILNLFPKKLIEYIAVHELAHLVHLKGKSREELSKLNVPIAEKVADYIAVLALGTPNIPFVKNRTYQSLGFIEGTLTRLKIPFKEALPNLGFEF